MERQGEEEKKGHVLKYDFRGVSVPKVAKKLRKMDLTLRGEEEGRSTPPSRRRRLEKTYNELKVHSMASVTRDFTVRTVRVPVLYNGLSGSLTRDCININRT